MTMRVEIAGKAAVCVGPPGQLADEIAAALSRNGAMMERAEGWSPVATDIIVLVATDAALHSARAETILREAYALMPEGGRMVIVASALGLIAARQAATESVRSAGLLALARTLAMEFAARRIAVNAVAVGAVEGQNGMSARMISHVPLKRGARLDEVATAVLFLCDPDNTYMTGHVLAVDGGWTAGYARDF